MSGILLGCCWGWELYECYMCTFYHQATSPTPRFYFYHPLPGAASITDTTVEELFAQKACWDLCVPDLRPRTGCISYVIKQYNTGSSMLPKFMTHCSGGQNCISKGLVDANSLKALGWDTILPSLLQPAEVSSLWHGVTVGLTLA